MDIEKSSTLIHPVLGEPHQIGGGGIYIADIGVDQGVTDDCDGVVVNGTIDRLENYDNNAGTTK